MRPPIVDGDVGIDDVSDGLEGQGRHLAIPEPRQRRVEGALHRRGVPRARGCQQAGRLERLDADDHRPVIHVMERAPAGDGAQQSTDASLDKHRVKRAVNLIHHARVAEHDQPRNILVARPGRIGYHRPAMNVGVSHDLPHRIVVRTPHPHDDRAFTGDGVDARLGHVRGHIHACLAAGLPGRAGDGAAMVALTGTRERRSRLQDSARQQMFDGKTCAEQLEGVQAEACGFVLGDQGPEAQGPRGAREHMRGSGRRQRPRTHGGAHRAVIET